MSRILFNPETGSPIKNVMYKDNLLFSSKEDSVFEPGMVIEVEDDIFDFLLGDDTKPGLFRFLEEMDPEEAKKYLAASKERLKCDQCEFATRLQSRLDIHKREHAKQKLTTSLGIPFVGVKEKSERISDSDLLRDRQAKWDDEDKSAGLTEGEGLVNDGPTRQVIMK